MALFDAGVLAGALEAVEGGAATMVEMLLDVKVRERANNWRYIGVVESVAPSYILRETRVVVFGTRHRRVARHVFVDLKTLFRPPGRVGIKGPVHIPMPP